MTTLPRESRRGDLERATVLRIGSRVVPPQVEAAGESGLHVHARLKRRVGGEPEVPMAVLGHRGSGRQWLGPAEDGAHVAPLVSVLTKAGRVVARLAVHHQEIGAGR